MTDGSFKASRKRRAKVSGSGLGGGAEEDRASDVEALRVLTIVDNLTSKESSAKTKKKGKLGFENNASRI